MHPPTHPPAAQQGGGNDLEDRLRGLILSNANEGTRSGTRQTVNTYSLTRGPSAPNVQEYATGSFAANATPSSLPPNFNAAPLEDVSHLGHQSRHDDATNMPHSTVQQGHRRLNQAQRRQMNSQFSVPLDETQAGDVQSRQGYVAPRANWRADRASQANYNPQMNYNQRHSYQHQQSPNFTNRDPSAQFSQRAAYSQATNQPSSNFSPSGSFPGYGSRHPQTNQANRHQSANGHGQGSSFNRPLPANRQLYQPNQFGGQGRGRQFVPNSEDIGTQTSYLSRLLQDHVSSIGISAEEEAEKESFRAVVEAACREAIVKYEKEKLGKPGFDASSVELKCFGSTSSGFATKASDMDLALLTPLSTPAADSPESPIPRILEKALLDLGYGARLLTRTRVPIIKLCQMPTPELLSGLLEARTKWENGFIPEPDEDDEEAVETMEARDDATTDRNHSSKEAQSSKKKTEKKSSEKVVKKANPTDKAELPVDDILALKLGSADAELATLKQKSNQSLSDYFNMAKRLLRKVGGRDVSAASQALTIDECEILNNVCRAFICGLSSEALIKRLQSSQNIGPLFDSSLPPIQRSLNGVWSQIEGERFAMAFENRLLLEANERHERECQKLVEDWRSLQSQTARLTEPLSYNRQLYMAAEKLKSFSSLQLVLLQQIQQEDPFFYQQRAQKIYDELKEQRDYSRDSIASTVISQYISGVWDPEIRQTLQNSSRSRYNLKDVAIEHRILHFADDYEHALENKVYSDSDEPIVREYLNFLRNDPFEKRLDSGLVSKMRGLPDPTTASPHKPRDRYKDELEFPKTGVGIQCDINFGAHLALHNTLLLRCYSHSDPRVKSLVLFVKNWAKTREINTPYRGTLSSYGYVLMVLHFLVNVAQPFVCPNLQLLHREPSSHLSPAEIEARTTCMNRDVRFWRNESEIKDLSSRGMLNHNHDSFGTLLRGFFEYYAQGGQMSTYRGRGFDWGREVLSLRTQGGILTKAEKGWVGAKTVIEVTTVAAPTNTSNFTQPGQSSNENQGPTREHEMESKDAKHQVKTVEETKEIRYRFLFAIEDPFELDHNVARTVTHNGIVSIRDEFRRAWRLIKNIGRPGQNESLLDPASTGNSHAPGLHELLDLIHGNDATGAKALA